MPHATEMPSPKRPEVVIEVTGPTSSVVTVISTDGRETKWSVRRGSLAERLLGLPASAGSGAAAG